MDWLNYHHLYYFWTVAKEGTISAASRKLHVSPSTISEQLQLLEQALDQPLFDRHGRSIKLNATGVVVQRYAETIFATGKELLDYVHGRPISGPLRLDVGVADVLPKVLVRRLLEPVFQMDMDIHLVCHTGHPDKLLSDLALHQLDVIFTDIPFAQNSPIQKFNHELGSSNIVWVGNPAVADQYRGKFPHSLHDAPVLLPTNNTVLRRFIDQWLSENNIQVNLVAEFEDSSVLKTFGAAGRGLFCVPEIILNDVCEQYNVSYVGTADGVVEKYYAISTDRHIEHPAVQELCKQAQEVLFQNPTVTLNAS